MIAYRALLGLTVIFVILECVPWAFSIPSYIFSPPSVALAAVEQHSSLFVRAFGYTIGNAIAGFTAAAMLSGSAVFISYVSPRVEGFVVTFVDALQSFPKESLFPIFILWVGFGPDAKILNAALLSFIPLFVAPFDAIKNVRRDYVQLFRSFGNTSKLAELRHCRVPQSIPVLHSAIRLGLPLAIVGSVLGEFLGGGEGLGYIIITAGTAFRMDRAFASVYTLAITGIVLLAIVDLVFRIGFRKYFVDAGIHY